jgi:hypothetical protein
VVPEKGSQPRFGKLRRETMKRIFILFSLFLALIIASTTYAKAPVDTVIKDLGGKYFVIGTKLCVQAAEGGQFVDPPKYKLNTTGITRMDQVTEELELFGDGTGFVNVKQLTIFNRDLSVANTYPMSGYAGTCDVSYSVIDNETLSFTFWNCTGELTAGAQWGYPAGQSEYVERARLSADGMTLVFTIIMPHIETVWTEDPVANVRTENNRICSRIATGIRRK